MFKVPQDCFVYTQANVIETVISPPSPSAESVSCTLSSWALLFLEAIAMGFDSSASADSCCYVSSFSLCLRNVESIRQEWTGPTYPHAEFHDLLVKCACVVCTTYHCFGCGYSLGLTPTRIREKVSHSSQEKVHGIISFDPDQM